MASLRANFSSTAMSFACAASLLLLSKDVNAGAATETAIASTAIVTINSINVNPAAVDTRAARWQPTLVLVNFSSPKLVPRH